MADKPAPEMIAKLPKWAQGYISDIEREREVALRVMNRYLDDQTVSPFYVFDLECTGEEKGPTKKIRYIQSWGRMCIKAYGVEVDIYLRDKDKRIDLQYGGENRAMGMVALVPESYQKISIMTRENMQR